MNMQAGYPIVYRTAIGWQVFIYLACAAAVAGGAAGLWNLAHGNGTGEGNGDTFLYWMCIAFVAFGLFGMLYTALFKITLEADSITLSSLFGSRALQRKDIAGFRRIEMQHGPPLLVFETRDSFQKPVKMSQAVRTDARLAQWMAGLVDLDSVEREQSQADVMADSELGSTPRERMQSVAQAHRIANALNAAAVLAGAWGWFYPHPYELAMSALAVLPFAAIALIVFSRGQYRLDSGRNEVRPNVAFVLITPAAVLALRALLDINLLRWQDGAQMAVLGMIVFAVLLNLGMRGADRKIGVVLVFAGFMSAYGYGAGVLADAWFDRAVPERFQSKVQDKYTTSGNRTEFHLKLAPWGPQTEPDDIAVNSPLYDALNPGDSACIALHKGALGAPWYVVDACH
jgi:hypothetical protein